MERGGPEIQHLGASSVRGLVSASEIARANRAARRSLELVEDHLRGVDAETTLLRLKSLRLFCELASSPVDDPESLGSLLERLASAHLTASSELALLRTRIGYLRSEGRLAELILAVAGDLLVTATSAIASGDGAELSFRAYEDDGWLMLVVETSGDAVEILPAEGAAALHRIRAAAAVLGGVVRRRCDEGRLGIAFTIETSVAARRPGAGRRGSS